MAEVSTTFDFQHKLFCSEGVYFALSSDKRPALFLALGDMAGSVILETLRTELGIAENHPDFRLLNTVEQSLRFVKKIHPGDSIPKELLDGSASWNVADVHRQTARYRLKVQLATWHLGEEKVLSDPEELQQVAEDPATEQRVETALNRLAQEAEDANARVARVQEKVASLTRDFAYIEALRDNYRKILGIRDQVGATFVRYRTDVSLSQNVQRILVLITPPIKDFQNVFDMIDAQTGEIFNMIKQFDPVTAFIRESRDDLHVRTMLWEEMVQTWADPPTKDVVAIERLIRKTYHFVATNFPQGMDWTAN